MGTRLIHQFMLASIVKPDFTLKLMNALVKLMQGRVRFHDISQQYFNKKYLRLM